MTDLQKSPALAEVLDLVRATGRSAAPVDQDISDLVFAVAVWRNLNPVALQAEVRAWAEGLR